MLQWRYCHCCNAKPLNDQRPFPMYGVLDCCVKTQYWGCRNSTAWFGHELPKWEALRARLSTLRATESQRSLTGASTVRAGHQLLRLSRLPVGDRVAQAEVTVVVGNDGTVRPLLSCWGKTGKMGMFTWHSSNKIFYFSQLTSVNCMVKGYIFIHVGAVYKEQLA